MIVLDTSALLYWTLDRSRLTPKAENVMDQADLVLISSISVWELALKVKHQKLTIPMSITDYVEMLQRIDALDILSVDVQTWLDNLELPWEHRDPADRTIVALATRFKCLLVTSDRAIADFYPETIW